MGTVIGPRPMGTVRGPIGIFRKVHGHYREGSMVFVTGFGFMCFCFLSDGGTILVRFPGGVSCWRGAGSGRVLTLG